MKTIPPTPFKFHRRKFLLIIVAALCCITYGSPAVHAEACLPFYALRENTAWPKYASVRVNISPSYSAAQRTAIQQTFNNWAGVATSAVSFSFTSNSSPITGPYSYQVNRQIPASCPCQAETDGNEQYGRRYDALTNLHPNVTDIMALNTLCPMK